MPNYYDDYLGRTVTDHAGRERSTEILGYDPQHPPPLEDGDPLLLAVLEIEANRKAAEANDGE